MNKISPGVRESSHVMIKMFNQKLVDQLNRVDIIGDLAIDQETFNQLHEAVSMCTNNFKMIDHFKKRRRAYAVYLVFCAVYEYEKNDGGYWKMLEKKFQRSLSEDDKNYLVEILETTIALHKNIRQQFVVNQSGSHSRIRKFLDQAGIPAKYLDSFITKIYRTIKDDDFDSFSIHAWLNYLRYDKRSTKNYLTYILKPNESLDLIRFTRKRLRNFETKTPITGNRIRLAQAIDRFRGTSSFRDQEELQKNVEIHGSPYISIDDQKVVLNLPRVNVKIFGKISWRLNDAVHACNEDEEFTINVNPDSQYILMLFLNGQEVQRWDFFGTDNGFLTFESNGKLIRSGELKESTRFIIITSNLDIQNKNDLSISEIRLNGEWSRFWAYQIDLEKIDSIQIGDQTVEVIREIKPIISGGKNLWDESEIYCELPDLEIGSEKISLKNYIENFGEYQIRVRPKLNCQIEFVPEVQFLTSCEEFPSDENGYENSRIEIQIPNETRLIPQNAQEIESNDNRIIYLLDNPSDEFFTAEFFYNDRSCIIRKRLHPLTWAVYSSTEIQNQNHILQIPLDDLLLDWFLYLESNLDLRIELRDQDENPMFEVPINRIPFSLSNCFAEIDRSNVQLYQLRLKLPDDRSFLIAKIGEEIDEFAIENFSMLQIEDQVLVEWDESGRKIDRELVLININHPWLNCLAISIPDGATSFEIDTKKINPGYYRVAIQKNDKPRNISEIETILPGFFHVHESKIKQILMKLLKIPYVEIDAARRLLSECTANLQDIKKIFPEDFDLMEKSKISLEKSTDIDPIWKRFIYDIISKIERKMLNES
ncbi:MAG: hypothetical protein IJ575_00860 [Selenomonadaceae bacterium]|nr:hypothetical protein [Selenomonadaceae bacterium]